MTKSSRKTSEERREALSKLITSQLSQGLADRVSG